MYHKDSKSAISSLLLAFSVSLISACGSSSDPEQPQQTQAEAFGPQSDSSSKSDPFIESDFEAQPESDDSEHEKPVQNSPNTFEIAETLFSIRIGFPLTTETDLPVNHVITNSSDWSDLWLKIQNQYSVNDPMPQLDFNQFQVLGIERFLENSCESVEIERIVESSKKITLEVAKESASVKDKRTMCSQEMSYYTEFILAPKSGKKLIFKDRNKKKSEK